MSGEVCPPADLADDPLAFGAVGVEQFGNRQTAQNHGELPAQIDHVLHAGVHGLGAGRAVSVRRFAAEEERPWRRIAAPGRPMAGIRRHQLTSRRRAGAGDIASKIFLQLVGRGDTATAGGRPWLGRDALEAVAAKREDSKVTVGSQEHADLIGGKIAVRAHVGQQEAPPGSLDVRRQPG
jgi:hypothetical protein